MDRNMQVPSEQKMMESKSLNQFADKDRGELYENLKNLPPCVDAKNQQKLIENGILPDFSLSDPNPFDNSRKLGNPKDAQADPSRTLDNAKRTSGNPSEVLDHLKEALSEPSGMLDHLKEALPDPRQILENLKGALGDVTRSLDDGKGLNTEMNPSRRPVTDTPNRTPEQAEQSKNIERPELNMDPSRRLNHARQTFDPNVWITE